MNGDNRPTLTPEQQAVCQQGILRLQQLLGVMDDLQECGEDCQLRRNTAKVEMDHYQKLLAKFGPR